VRQVKCTGNLFNSLSSSPLASCAQWARWSVAVRCRCRPAAAVRLWAAWSPSSLARSVHRTSDTNQPHTAGTHTPHRCLPLYAAVASRSPLSIAQRICSGGHLIFGFPALQLHTAAEWGDNKRIHIRDCARSCSSLARSVRQFFPFAPSSESEVLFSSPRDGRARIQSADHRVRQSSAWAIGDEVSAGSVTPLQSYKVADGCRESDPKIDSCSFENLYRTHPRVGALAIVCADSLLLCLSAPLMPRSSLLSSSCSVPSNHTPPPPHGLHMTQ
jgi:hypothetical protein